MTCQEVSGGYKYTILDGDHVVDTRKSYRTYVAASVPMNPKTNKYLRPLYHGRLDLIGKGEAAKYARDGYQVLVARIQNQ